MSTVLGKVKRLEEYMASTNASSLDNVLELTIDKLLDRETSRLISQKARLEQQLADFEQRYSLSSEEFYERFEQGELGDAMDFVEWSATYEMAANLQHRLSILGREEVSPS
jgi:hypothetical protein